MGCVEIKALKASFWPEMSALKTTTTIQQVFNEDLWCGNGTNGLLNFSNEDVQEKEEDFVVEDDDEEEEGYSSVSSQEHDLKTCSDGPSIIKNEFGSIPESELSVPVQTLINPTIDEFRQVMESLKPNMVYLLGEQLVNEEGIGSLVWGGVDLSTPEAISGIFNSTLPTTKKGGSNGKVTEEKKKAPEKESTAKDVEVSVSLLSIQVGLIRKAWKHPSADSLLVEEIDLGDGGICQVVSGLAKHCSPDALMNRRVAWLQT